MGWGIFQKLQAGPVDVSALLGLSTGTATLVRRGDVVQLDLESARVLGDGWYNAPETIPAEYWPVNAYARLLVSNQAGQSRRVYVRSTGLVSLPAADPAEYLTGTVTYLGRGSILGGGA